MKKYSLPILSVIIIAIAFFAFTRPPSKTIPHDQDETGEVTIGGTFTLTNQNGKQVSDADFRGKLMLVYFGYTFCPDVCPGDLLTMTSALNTLGDDAKKIVPIFITVDPERDTVEQMHSYIENFHPSFEALTGTPEAIDAVAKKYKIYYAKVQDPGMTTYLMDHSAITYLMDGQGKYLMHFPHGTDAETMAKGLRKYL